MLCLDDWIDADILGCYKFLDAKINHTWVEAQYDCEQVGGYLAEPTTHRSVIEAGLVLCHVGMQS